MDTATELRQQATKHAQDAIDSFDRCDTDGFLSQWASGVMSQKKSLEADLLEAGGVWEFEALFDLDGNRIPAKLINGRYGTCWAICDANGEFTGKFINFVGCAPWEGNYDADNYKAVMRGYNKRVANLRAKGYVEGAEKARAKVIMTGSNHCTVRAIIVRTDGGYPGANS